MDSSVAASTRVPAPAPAASASSQPAAVRVETPKPPQPVRVEKLQAGVELRIFVEGDGRTFPKESVEAHLVGRLPVGCVFESTKGKGNPAMRMELGKNAIIPGMELGLRSLSLGAIAELHIPSRLGYAHIGVPKIVPPDTDLLFDIDLVTVDGVHAPEREPVGADDFHGEGGSGSITAADGGDAQTLAHPWWLARVQRPPPSSYYLSFGRHLARGVPAHILDRAVPIPRRTRAEAEGWDLTGTALIIQGVQDCWRAKEEWGLDWFKEHLGAQRQLVKWQGPVFTKMENLWDSPVWETSLCDYVDYVRAVDTVDPSCDPQNAASCPRLYLNGWPAFKQFPWLREYIVNPTFFDDVSGDLLADDEELRECFLQGLSRGYTPPAEEERREQIDASYWELTKLFISPRGAITRLHYDNGGAHAWLSQVQGRKLFVCFAPEDGEHLHPFEGDEGLMNASWIDPLDSEVLSKWPDYAKATPYIAVVEEGETIVAPQGWWHYAVSLDASITIMRNFFSKGNKHELIRRKDDQLATAMAQHVLKAKLKNQPDELLKQIASKTVAQIRKGLDGRPGPAKLRPSTGGPSAVARKAAAPSPLPPRR